MGAAPAPFSRVERLAIGLLGTINERPTLKAIQAAFHRHLSQRWVHLCSRNLVHVHGLDEVHGLAPERGVLLCANHRSFFDLYVVSMVLVRAVPWVGELTFPVRASFFYETWRGVALNLLVGGGAMYPPIFRDPARAELNRAALARVERFLDRPGAVVGLHPEGRRNGGPDPYQLLPAQPGAGQLALRARVPVVPVWIHGLSNDVVRQIAANFRRAGPREGRAGPLGRGRSILVVFGPPVDLGGLRDERPRAALYKKASDRILEDIRRLGERERALRAALEGSARE